MSKNDLFNDMSIDSILNDVKQLTGEQTAPERLWSLDEIDALLADDTVENKYRYKGVLARSEEITGSYTRCFGPELTSSDGIKYKVLTWWNKYNTDFIIKFALAQGWVVNTTEE